MSAKKKINLKAEKKKEAEKEKQKMQKGKEKAKPYILEMFVSKYLKKSAVEEPGPSVKLLKKKLSEFLPDEDSDNGSNDEESVGGGNEEMKVVVDLASLVDIKKPQPKLGKQRSGRPANILIDNLSQHCYHIDNPGKHIF